MVTRKGTGFFFWSEIFTHFAEVLDAWAASDPGQLEYFWWQVAYNFVTWTIPDGFF